MLSKKIIKVSSQMKVIRQKSMISFVILCQARKVPEKFMIKIPFLSCPEVPFYSRKVPEINCKSTISVMTQSSLLFKKSS
jgi:hypothetical protein